MLQDSVKHCNSYVHAETHRLPLPRLPAVPLFDSLCHLTQESREPPSGIWHEGEMDSGFSTLASPDFFRI